MQYFIRQLSSGHYEIAKCDDGDLPEAIYTVADSKCNCPGGTKRGTCKHISMITRWKPFHYFEQGRGEPMLLPLPEALQQEESDGL